MRAAAKRPRRRSALTIREQMTVFLDKWEAVRIGQIEKHGLSAVSQRRFDPKAGLWLHHEHAADHYRHELKMLRELRKRALS